MLPDPVWVDGIMGKLSSFAQQIIDVLEYIEMMQNVYETVALPILRNTPAGPAVAIMPSVVGGIASAVVPGFSEGGAVDVSTGPLLTAVQTPINKLPAMIPLQPRRQVSTSADRGIAARREQSLRDRRRQEDDAIPRHAEGGVPGIDAQIDASGADFAPGFSVGQPRPTPAQIRKHRESVTLNSVGLAWLNANGYKVQVDRPRRR